MDPDLDRVAAVGAKASIAYTSERTLVVADPRYTTRVTLFSSADAAERRRAAERRLATTPVAPPLYAADVHATGVDVAAMFSTIALPPSFVERARATPALVATAATVDGPPLDELAPAARARVRDALASAFETLRTTLAPDVLHTVAPSHVRVTRTGVRIVNAASLAPLDGDASAHYARLATELCTSRKRVRDTARARAGDVATAMLRPYLEPPVTSISADAFAAAVRVNDESAREYCYCARAFPPRREDGRGRLVRECVNRRTHGPMAVAVYAHFAGAVRAALLAAGRTSPTIAVHDDERACIACGAATAELACSFATHVRDCEPLRLVCDVVRVALALERPSRAQQLAPSARAWRTRGHRSPLEARLAAAAEYARVRDELAAAAGAARARLDAWTTDSVEARELLTYVTTLLESRQFTALDGLRV